MKVARCSPRPSRRSPSLVACGGAPPPKVEEPVKEESHERKGPNLQMSQELGSIDQRQVEKTFAGLVQGPLENCHKQGRDRVEVLTGDVKVFLRIDGNGRVKYGFFEDSTLGDRDTEKCIMGVFSSASWPKPEGGEAEVRSGFGWGPGGEREPTSWSSDKVTTALMEAKAVRKDVDKCKGSRQRRLPRDGVRRGGRARARRPSRLARSARPSPQRSPRAASRAREGEGGGEVGHFKAIGIAPPNKEGAEKTRLHRRCAASPSSCRAPAATWRRSRSRSERITEGTSWTSRSTRPRRLVQRTARDYATRVIMPEAAAIDREERFPTAILKGLAELGLMAVNVPDGARRRRRAGAVAYSLAMQEVARACASTAVTMAVTNMVGEVIAAFGTEEQKQKYNPKLASGEYAAGAFALSEPRPGSDPGGMRTTATRDGDGWVLDGQKQWITSGAHAGVMVVWARTGDREKPRHARASRASSSRAARPGSRSARPRTRWACAARTPWRSRSTTAASRRARCSASWTRGFKIAMMALDGGRIGIASQAIGIARAALEESVRLRTRAQAVRQAHRRVPGHPVDARRHGDRARRRAPARAARRVAEGAGPPFSREASMAKLFATRGARTASATAVQIHGGYGYMREFAAERHLRDVRVTTIYEGTSEIQRIVIARSALS